MAKSKPNKTEPRMDAERVRQALQSGVVSVRGLTPETLNRALENFGMGYLRDAALLWQKAKDRDDTIKSVSEKRELEAALLDWEILPLDDSPEAASHKQALEEFYNNLTATHALDQNQRGGVSTLIRQMMHAVGHKYAVHEIVWQPGTSAGLTAEFRFVPLQFFENTLGRLRFMASDYAASGEDLEEGGWMVTTGAGLMEACGIAYLFKNLPLKSWLIFCDKFGQPGLHGETSAAKGSEEWNAMRDALANFAQDWALLTSAGSKITPIEVNAAGTGPHKDLVDRMDRAISRLWRGADLGTMSQGGAAVGSNPQESETDILAAADAAIVTETLQHYVDAWVIRYRFGATPKAYFKLQARTRVNQELELKIDDALIKWGVPRGKTDLLAKYNRPEPDAGDELASAPPAANPFGPPPPAAALANEAAAVGRAALFQANAVARELAARRPVFRPLAERLAALLAAPDAAAFAAATAGLKTDATRIYAGIVAAAPDLARPAEEALGTALISGFVEAQSAKNAAHSSKS